MVGALVERGAEDEEDEGEGALLEPGVEPSLHARGVVDAARLIGRALASWSTVAKGAKSTEDEDISGDGTRRENSAALGERRRVARRQSGRCCAVRPPGCAGEGSGGATGGKEARARSGPLSAPRDRTAARNYMCFRPRDALLCEELVPFERQGARANSRGCEQRPAAEGPCVGLLVRVGGCADRRTERKASYDARARV